MIQEKQQNTRSCLSEKESHSLSRQKVAKIKEEELLTL
jgi:hypothetical protein